MIHLSPEDITRLHNRHALAGDGTPQMTEGMVLYLTRSSSGAVVDREGVTLADLGPSRPGTPPAPLSFTEAWARLRAEEPHLAAAVQATVIHKLTVRDAVPVLGVSFATVARRKGEGLAALVVWTGLDASIVARQICALTA